MCRYITDAEKKRNTPTSVRSSGGRKRRVSCLVRERATLLEAKLQQLVCHANALQQGNFSSSFDTLFLMNCTRNLRTCLFDMKVMQKRVGCLRVVSTNIKLDPSCHRPRRSPSLSLSQPHHRRGACAIFKQTRSFFLAIEYIQKLLLLCKRNSNKFRLTLILGL